MTCSSAFLKSGFRCRPERLDDVRGEARLDRGLLVRDPGVGRAPGPRGGEHDQLEQALVQLAVLAERERHPVGRVGERRVAQPHAERAGDLRAAAPAPPRRAPSARASALPSSTVQGEPNVPPDLFQRRAAVRRPHVEGLQENSDHGVVADGADQLHGALLAELLRSPCRSRPGSARWSP